MGFKRTSEGRVFFAGSKGFSNDDKMREANSKIPPLTDDKSDSGSASLRTPESQMQILSLLKSWNEKLQLSQIERSSMRQELQSYRDLVERLENKAEAAERKQQALQEKLSHDSASIQKAETTAA